MQKIKRDYVFMLVFMILSFIFLGPLGKIGKGNIRMVEAGTAIIVIFWYFFCYRVTSNFSGKWLKIGYAMLLIFQVSALSFVSLKDGIPIYSITGIATIAYCANLIGFSLVFYIMLKDIFSQRHDLVHSLLGATNIYLMIPILFSYLFSLVTINHPEWVHADPISVKTILTNCFNYSYFTFAGMDYPGEKIAEEIQSLGVFESISGNLFIVFVIGRLMMK